MKKSTKITAYAVAASAATVVVATMLRPTPTPVDSAVVQFGPMRVTMDEQGETRSRDRFVVAAPVAGRLLRITLRAGDRVTAGQTVAILAPVPLGERERGELTARVAAAEAALQASRADRQHAHQDLDQARRERRRTDQLYRDGFVAAQAVERARNAETTLLNDAQAADQREMIASAELRAARAGIVALASGIPGRPATIEVRAPADGQVLRVEEMSERIVSAGAPLLVIGDLGRMEAVLEMLSSDAVNVKPGMPATIVESGVDRELRAIVRRVEPHAYTKVSALGIEEKRANVVLDLLDPPGPLGDGYRVTGRVTLWSSQHALLAPLASLFRCGTRWCVFVVNENRAWRREVLIGRRNSSKVVILGGLAAGERVIVHPPNELVDRARIRPL